MTANILKFIGNLEKIKNGQQFFYGGPVVNGRLKEAGYFCVPVKFMSIDYPTWCEMVLWCKKTCGEDYAWSNDAIWFEKSDHATWFSLKWT